MWDGSYQHLPACKQEREFVCVRERDHNLIQVDQQAKMWGIKDKWASEHQFEKFGTTTGVEEDK